MKEFSTYQQIDKFTRITKYSETMIDLIITNSKEIKFKTHRTPKVTDQGITIDLLQKA